jgi:hypothetical protein
MTDPPERGHSELAYDGNTQSVVLFGDTWPLAVTSPPGTCGHVMVYDASRQRVLLFNDDETWLFLP